MHEGDGVSSKTLGKSLFNCKMTGPAVVLPASPDFWKAPLVVCKHWVLKLSECGGLTSICVILHIILSLILQSLITIT